MVSRPASPPDTAALEARIEALTLQLDEARTALQARKDVGNFVPHLGHELRTPLNAILGFSQVLASDSLPTTNDQKKRFAEHILKAGRDLLGLINQTVDLLKLDALPGKIEAVELADLLAKCAAVVTPMAEARAIDLRLPQDFRASLMTDPERLLTGLLAVFDNAVRYNRTAGSVTVGCHVDADSHVHVRVEDTGPGLDAVQMAHLFEPFNRLGQENGKTEGRGLSLYLAQRLLRSLGGDIRASASPEAGSVFTTVVPLAAPLATLPAVRGDPGQGGQG